MESYSVRCKKYTKKNKSELEILVVVKQWCYQNVQNAEVKN